MRYCLFPLQSVPVMASTLALLLATMPPTAQAEIQGCIQALARLNTAPYNASLPFLNGVSGHVNVAYLYQKPMFAVMPNEAMGNFDLCRHSELYTSGLVKTHYCALSHDKAGICVPTECRAEDLHNKAILQPVMNLGIHASTVIPEECAMNLYLTQGCAYSRQALEYFHSLYNLLVLLGNDTPQSTGSVTCTTRAHTAEASAYTMLGFTLLFATLALFGAAWQYFHAVAHHGDKRALISFSSAVPSSKPSSSAKSDKKQSDASSLPSPGSKVVALTVKASPGREASDLQDIPLEEVNEQPEGTPRSRKNNNEKKGVLKSKSSNSNKLAVLDSAAATTAMVATSTKQPDMVELMAQVLKVPPCPKPISAFSFVDNLNEIFTLKARGGEFAIFDGMKAISAAWVVFYHVLLWQIYLVQNPEYLVPPKGLLSKLWATPFFNYSGTLSVDTFFFISGFLASYMLLVKLDKEHAKGLSKPAYKWIPSLYLHRWLRITPAYMFAFFLHWKIAPLLAYGPLAATVWENNIRPCRGVWWSHFLYLNDIYPWWNQRLGEVCYGHSWYLANDMQYYLLVPFFCLLYRSPRINGKKLATYAVWACLLTCIIVSWTLTIKDNWSPNSWDGVDGDHYREEGFSRPWTRCSSYMIGILFSYMWYEKKQGNPDGKFHTFQANFLWVSGLVLLAVSMYGPHSGSAGVIPCAIAAPGTPCGSNWSPSTRAAIIALLRPTWTLGLGCLSVLCWNNQGGFIQKFLAAPLWFPLSTLSFCIYLVHYTVLTYYISQRTMRIRFELFGFLNTYFGLMAISCGLALFVVLLVEKPFMKLQKYFLEKPAPARNNKGDGPATSGQKEKEWTPAHDASLDSLKEAVTPTGTVLHCTCDDH